MKVRKLKGIFEPIEITLESEEEVDSLRTLMGFFDGSEVPRQVETFIIGLNAKIRNLKK